jgi:hypothetical protein
MIFRIHFTVAGGHVHCRLFLAPAPNRTFAKCGDFTVRRGPEFVALMAAFDADFVGDDPAVGVAAASTAEGQE